MSAIAQGPIRSTLKNLLPLLPKPIQNSLRESHYLNKLRCVALDDEPDLAAIAQWVRPGDTVLDIGANYGLYTRFLSERVGPEGKVHAFEPSSVMGHVLRRNVAALGLGNVSVSACALSDKKGQARLHVPQFENAAPNYYEASILPIENAPLAECEAVETTSIDSYVEANGIDGVSFLKIDVEGHELAVLQGGRETFRRFRPTALLEVNAPLHEAGHGADVLEVIRSLDCEVFVIDPSGTRSWTPGETFVNYLLRPRELS